MTEEARILKSASISSPVSWGQMTWRPEDHPSVSNCCARRKRGDFGLNQAQVRSGPRTASTSGFYHTEPPYRLVDTGSARGNRWPYLELDVTVFGQSSQ